MEQGQVSDRSADYRPEKFIIQTITTMWATGGEPSTILIDLISFGKSMTFMEFVRKIYWIHVKREYLITLYFLFSEYKCWIAADAIKIWKNMNVLPSRHYILHKLLSTFPDWLMAKTETELRLLLGFGEFCKQNTV